MKFSKLLNLAIAQLTSKIERFCDCSCYFRAQFWQNTVNWHCMKEAHMFFSEMELIHRQCLSCEDRQALESKGVSKDPQKQVSLGTQWGRGALLFCHAIQQTLLYFFFSFNGPCAPKEKWHRKEYTTIMESLVCVSGFCSDIIFWTTEPFVARGGIVIHHDEWE